jgi:hypothetical protein
MKPASISTISHNWGGWGDIPLLLMARFDAGREFSNPLTVKIKEGDAPGGSSLPVVEFLCHPDVHAASRADAPALDDYIQRYDPYRSNNRMSDPSTFPNDAACDWRCPLRLYAMLRSVPRECRSGRRKG